MRLNYYPLRQQALILSAIHVVVSILSGLGVANDVLNNYAAIAIQFVDVLVMLGILVPQTENKTTPLDASGRPLNPDYHHRLDDAPAL